MSQSNQRPCQWKDCSNAASKRVTFNRQVGETEIVGNVGTFPISFSESDLCDVHVSELRNHYSDVGEREIGGYLG